MIGVGGRCGGERIVRLYQSCRNSGVCDVCLRLCCGGVGGVGGWLGLGGWCGVMYVCVVSMDALWRWQVQVSVYYARQIPAQLRCTQCSIMLHLMGICFLTCICLWQISQIHTFLGVVVGSGLVSASPVFMSAIHPAGPHGLLAPKH